MESYHIRIKAVYDNFITAGSFAEASEQAENEIAPGRISEEIHVSKEGVFNEMDKKKKIINQLINRDGSVHIVMICPIYVDKDETWCKNHLLCSDCINAWLDEKEGDNG